MIARFITYLEAERRFSPLTVGNYRRDVERFVAWWCATDTGFRPFVPNEVSGDDLSHWVMLRGDRDKVQAASINRELCSLRAFFRFLRREGLLDKELFTRIRSLKTPQRLPSFVPETRMKPLVEACMEDAVGHTDFEQERDHLIILLLYACGLRLAELVGINREDFAADFHSLRIRGKGNKERLVPILPFVREKILAHLDTILRQQICKCAEKALFLTIRGCRISRSGVYRLVNRVLGEAGVQGKKSPHVLRHTFATHLMNGGADMREIQELMGHASLQSTQVYTHNSIAQLREVYAKAHPRSKGGGIKRRCRR